jgi:tRNA 2-thiouridine synthesizing protein A
MPADHREVTALSSKLDLLGEICPYTFVKTKLALENLEAGDLLEVTFDDEGALRDVPRGVASEGHTVLSIDRNGDARWKVLIRKEERK